MEIKLKINTDKILAETGITIDEPEQWMGESLFPSSNGNALSVPQGRTEGHRWVKDAIPINRAGNNFQMNFTLRSVSQLLDLDDGTDRIKVEA